MAFPSNQSDCMFHTNKQSIISITASIQFIIGFINGNSKKKQLSTMS